MPKRFKSCSQRLPGDLEQRRTVTRGVMVRLSGKAYSLPSRLQQDQVRVRLYASWLEIGRGGLVARHERALGKRAGVIDYRHLVGSLRGKPGAFAQYRYR